MKLSPYLNFDGTCKEAFEFYARCLKGEIVMMMTIGGSPMAEHVPPEAHGRIMHVNLRVGDVALMGSDSQIGTHVAPQGFHVSLVFDDVGESERVFAGLAEGGTVGMPLQQTFWAKRFGLLTDRFGTPWMVNCE